MERRVVASPLPVSIVDSALIEKLVGLRAVVICGGGGGIPVSIEDGKIKGVEAVVDKDRLSALLAISLKADALVISTGIDSVKLNFGKENEQSLDSLSVELALRYLEEGHFPAGSMAPKIGSLIEAVSHVPSMVTILCSQVMQFRPSEESQVL